MKPADYFKDPEFVRKYQQLPDEGKDAFFSQVEPRYAQLPDEGKAQYRSGMEGGSPPLQGGIEQKVELNPFENFGNAFTNEATLNIADRPTNGGISGFLGALLGGSVPIVGGALAGAGAGLAGGPAAPITVPLGAFYGGIGAAGLQEAARDYDYQRDMGVENKNINPWTVLGSGGIGAGLQAFVPGGTVAKQAIKNIGVNALGELPLSLIRQGIHEGEIDPQRVLMDVAAAGGAGGAGHLISQATKAPKLIAEQNQKRQIRNNLRAKYEPQLNVSGRIIPRYQAPDITGPADGFRNYVKHEKLRQNEVAQRNRIETARANRKAGRRAEMQRGQIANLNRRSGQLPDYPDQLAREQAQRAKDNERIQKLKKDYQEGRKKVPRYAPNADLMDKYRARQGKKFDKRYYPNREKLQAQVKKAERDQYSKVKQKQIEDARTARKAKRTAEQTQRTQANVRRREIAKLSPKVEESNREALKNVGRARVYEKLSKKQQDAQQKSEATRVKRAVKPNRQEAIANLNAKKIMKKTKGKKSMNVDEYLDLTEQRERQRKAEIRRQKAKEYRDSLPPTDRQLEAQAVSDVIHQMKQKSADRVSAYETFQRLGFREAPPHPTSQPGKYYGFMIPYNGKVTISEKESLTSFGKYTPGGINDNALNTIYRRIYDTGEIDNLRAGLGEDLEDTGQTLDYDAWNAISQQVERDLQKTDDELNAAYGRAISEYEARYNELDRAKTREEIFDAWSKYEKMEESSLLGEDLTNEMADLYASKAEAFYDEYLPKTENQTTAQKTVSKTNTRANDTQSRSAKTGEAKQQATLTKAVEKFESVKTEKNKTLLATQIHQMAEELSEADFVKALKDKPQNVIDDIGRRLGC